MSPMPEVEVIGARSEARHLKRSPAIKKGQADRGRRDCWRSISGDSPPGQESMEQPAFYQTLGVILVYNRPTLH
jgi:hypothetical protein